MFYVFYNLRNVLSNRIAYRVYDALVGSVLLYAIVVWGEKFGGCTKLNFENHSWGWKMVWYR